MYYLKQEDSGIYECRNANGQLLQAFMLEVNESNSTSTSDETTPLNNVENKWPTRPNNVEDEDDDERRNAPHSENYGRLSSQIEFSCGSDPNDRFIEWKRLDGGRVNYFIIPIP